MSKYFITLIMLIFLYGNANSQWTYVSTIPTAPYINSISVVNENVIWVCCDAGKVFKSTNGGVNWVERSFGLGSGNLYGISALDTTNCWIGSVSGTIYNTTNGGYNWNVQLTVSGSFSDGIKMFNANYGIYFGDPTAANGQPMQFRYTTNGGANWLLSPNSPIVSNEYGVLNGWDWLDTSTVWLGIANVVSAATNSKVYKTASGFGSGVWSAGLFGGAGTTQGLYANAVGFNDAANGLIGLNTSAFRKSTNGGSTWTAVSNPPGLTSYSVTNINAMKNGSNVTRVMVYSGTTSYCFRTTNLGTDWISEPLPSQASIVKIEHMQFANPSLGYAGGMGGVFIKYIGPSGINYANNLIPSEYRLEQNFPNPFNPSTTINFSIPKAENVSLKVYDVLGKEIATLVNDFKTAGNYSYDFNAGSNLTSGIYFYTLSTDNFISTKKLTLIK